MSPGAATTLHGTLFTVPPDLAGQRLDRALAALAGRREDLAGLSRSRLAGAIAGGALTDAAGAVVADHRRKVKAGERFLLTLAPPAPPTPRPEPIPLDVLYEDADLIVVDKPAGMVVHPAPGAETGTLVNALLHHCGESLTGIGGERRPGIVHRIDRGTSGILVAAKTQGAHAGLSAAFAAHDIERVYRAVCWGAPDRADPRLAGLPGVGFEPGEAIRIDAPIARHPTDRKRMAVARSGGRRAVTRLWRRESYGTRDRPLASLLECRLETGRTHQIRVHAAHIGHGLVGDPVYGGRRTLPAGIDAALAKTMGGLSRQALHAARLGFSHPVSGEALCFEAPLPRDLLDLVEMLRRKAGIIR